MLRRIERLEIFDEFEEWHLMQVSPQMKDEVLLCNTAASIPTSAQFTCEQVHMHSSVKVCHTTLIWV